MKPRYRLVLILVAVLMALGTGLVLLGRRVAPPSSVRTFEDFLRWKPESTSFTLHNASGESYLQAFVDRERLFGLMSSGPSCYAFDDQGFLVDWTADSWRDPEYARKWGSPGSEILTRDQALEFLKRSRETE